MSENPAKEAFNDLLTYLEQVQNRCEALFRFLLDNGTVSNEKLTPYLEQASKASDVRSVRRVRASNICSTLNRRQNRPRNL